MNHEDREYGEHSSLIGVNPNSNYPNYASNSNPNTRAINLSIMVLGEDIEEAVVESNDVIKENSIFTINGRKINSLDDAPSGIYIVNGKKVIKK